ncbi:MAG TPA: WYL domain-containing protein [Patescibacteria group bacterium]|nr:WYL domain-containing protein [Patescibacteria group bacterium]
MAKKLAYERYLWFHERLRGKKYPKLGDLADRFEISRRQAAREIEFMRLFLEAPIEYSGGHNGYYYSSENFEFPCFWVTEEEIVSLIVARRLAAAMPDRDLKKKLDSFLEKIGKNIDLDLPRLESRISLKNVRYCRVEAAIFSAVLLALSRERQLAITYASGYTDETSQRTVDPLHLLLYMGNWHLIAWCRQKRGMRDFLLSRMHGAEVLAEKAEKHAAALEVKEKIERRYGIFFDGPATPVVLRFCPGSARTVRDQVWFPGQVSEIQEDGSLILKFPVADFREIIRDLLPFAADVEVLEPPALRQLISETIARMAGMYRKK